jgi:HupE / UreJ protein
VLKQPVIHLVAALGITAFVASAHDIPNDVTIQAFLVPEGNRAHLLIRVPLVSMRDMNFPEQAGGYIDMERSAPLLADATLTWMATFIELYEGSTLLPKPSVAASRISMPGDKSFQSYEDAMAHFHAPPLTNSTLIFWNQVSMDVLLDFPIASDRSEFSIHPGLARLGQRVVTVLRFLPPNPSGGERVVRAFEYEGDPGLVRLDPRWYQAAGRFVGLGFRHILDGTDHLLFLFCLVIPFRKFRALIPIVTAFTVAHSITLIASAYNLGPDALWFPPMIEVGIALSILYMALENIVGGSTVHKRWVIAFAFGLVHGFGFSFALRETLQFAGRHMLTSLLSFNVGVELGQLLVLLVMIPVLELLFRYVVAERMGIIILSALVAHTAWHWMQDRWAVLSKFHIGMPEMTPALLVTLLRWAMVAVAVAGVWWWIGTVRQGRAGKNAGK